jgi:fructose-1,6-bisphosphatase/inositol monophosphatase family enzyme
MVRQGFSEKTPRGHQQIAANLLSHAWLKPSTPAVALLAASRNSPGDIMTDDNDQRMRFARDLAFRAGELALTYFRALDTLTIESKGHQDLVSDGDRDVETFIRAAIGAEYPDDGVVGEEHANLAGTSGYVWIIDPIDGTANFVRGIPAWTVVIAGVRDGAPDVGVIHEPSTGENFSSSTRAACSTAMPPAR